MMGAAVRAVLLLALALAGALARAQTPADDLYQEALQSIAEGRKSDAFESLLRLIDKEPQHAAAWLEVALLQCELGHKQEAEHLFTAIEERFAPPPGIRVLIQEARAGGCAHWQAHRSASLLAGRGYDYNVNQGASNPVYVITRPDGTISLPLLDEFLPHRDAYSVVSGEVLRDLSPNGLSGFAQFQARRNDHLAKCDSASLFTGLDNPWRFGRWTLRGSALAGVVSLGGRLYQRQGQLQARLGPPIPLPNHMQLTVLAGLSRTVYLTLVNFNATTYELRSQLTYRNEDQSVSASIARLDDRAAALRPGGDRTGSLFTVSGRSALGDKWSGELAFSRQRWDAERAYAPGLIEEVRQQRTDVLRAALTYPLSKNHALQIEARAVRNKENISIFQYNSRQLQFSWQWQGP